MTAYIRRLRKEAAEQEAASRPPNDKLKERVARWFGAQPIVSRHRPYSMSEIESGVGVAGRFLSSALLDLGWERRRRWTTGNEGTRRTQYPRFWEPPAYRP